jgi:hypothetical protein
MFKKIILPIGILFSAIFIYRKLNLLDRITYSIKKIRLDISFATQNLIFTLGINNPTKETGVLQDFNGKLYFIDTNDKESFLANVSLDNKIINIAADSITYADFVVNLFSVGFISNIISLITNKKGSIKFIGIAKAFNVKIPINNTYNL